jgi:hypothetical protein
VFHAPIGGKKTCRKPPGGPQEAHRRPPSVRLCECERGLPSSLAIIIRRHLANQEWVVVHRPSSMLWGGVFCTVCFEIFDCHNIEGSARKNHRARRSRKHRFAKLRNISES